MSFQLAKTKRKKKITYMIWICYCILVSFSSCHAVATGEGKSDIDEVGKTRELIVNGDIANPADYSFFGLTAKDAYDSTPDNQCGATLIHPDILITAAHCQGFFNYGVLLYNPLTNQFDRRKEIVAQFRHPNWNLNNEKFNWDFLLLRLDSPVYDIQPIAINDDPNIPARRDSLQMIGLGATVHQGPLSNTLRSGQLEYMTPDVCKERLERFRITGIDIADELLCGSRTDSEQSICQGDSGGPLLYQNSVLVGVTSWTIRCESDEIPDGFARISTVYDWIQKVICDESIDGPATCPQALEQSQSVEELVEMSLHFRHDFSAEDTTFAVRSKESGTIAYAGPTYVVSNRESTETWISSFFLPIGNYTFEVYDRENNGLTDTMFDSRLGSWDLYAKEGASQFSLVASGSHLFFEESFTDFQVERIQHTSTVPSSSPSPSTVSGSTSIPTASHSSNRIETQFPSIEASMNPSLNPITSMHPTSTNSSESKFIEKGSKGGFAVAATFSISILIISIVFLLRTKYFVRSQKAWQIFAVTFTRAPNPIHGSATLHKLAHRCTEDVPIANKEPIGASIGMLKIYELVLEHLSKLRGRMHSRWIKNRSFSQDTNIVVSSMHLQSSSPSPSSEVDNLDGDNSSRFEMEQDI